MYVGKHVAYKRSDRVGVQGYMFTGCAAGFCRHAVLLVGVQGCGWACRVDFGQRLLCLWRRVGMGAKQCTLFA
jgi:hypothetical protein